MKNNKGISLIELIVVISIMTVLTGVIAPQFLGYSDKAKRSVALQNCDTVVKTAQVHIAETEETNLTAPYDEIKARSNVQGEIEDIQVTVDGTITYLRYKGVYTVIYEDGEYRILEDGEISNGSQNDGWVLVDSNGEEHVFEASITSAEVFQLIEDSENNGISILPGTILKEGEDYYVVGYNDWFSGDGSDSIGEYNNVLKLDDDYIYTENDMVDSWGEQVWPNNIEKGDICYYGDSYYIAPNDVNIYTKPPGGWIEIE